jgi:predicted PurR-regulated permease PerM
VERTPIPITARTRAVLVAVAVLALVWLAWQAPTVPRLVLFGGALALVLSFPVRMLQRLMPRSVAIGVVVVGLLLTIAVLISLIPLGNAQLTELVGALPGYVDQAERALERGVAWLSRRGLVAGDPEEVIADVRAGIIARAQRLGEGVLAGALDRLSGTLSAAIQLFGTLLIAVYLLADIGRFKAILVATAPPPLRDDAEALWWHLEHSLSRYLGGLLVSISVQGVAAAVALSLLGVPFALLLGLWTAATAVLPYVGAWLAGIPAVALALMVSPTTAVLAAAIFFAINLVEGNLLTPRIQGDAVRVHPLLVFLAVIAGSEVAGLVGAALAVPALAVLRVLVDFFGDRLYVPQPTGEGRDRAGVMARPSE